MRKIFKISLGIGIILLTGCTATAIRDDLDEMGGDRLEALAQLTTADARAALSAAELAGDERAAACWRELIPLAERVARYRAAVEKLETGLSGYLLVYQRARNVRRFIQRPPEELEVACAPMLAESRDTIRSLLNLVGVPGL